MPYTNLCVNNNVEESVKMDYGCFEIWFHSCPLKGVGGLVRDSWEWGVIVRSERDEWEGGRCEW